MASLFGRMTGVGTPAYRWFDLITSLRSSAILLVLFLDDFVCHAVYGNDFICRIVFVVFVTG